MVRLSSISRGQQLLLVMEMIKAQRQRRNRCRDNEQHASFRVRLVVVCQSVVLIVSVSEAVASSSGADVGGLTEAGDPPVFECATARAWQSFFKFLMSM